MQNSYQFAFTKVFSLKSVLLHHSHIFRQSGYCRSQDLTSNSGGVFNAHCMCEFAFVFSPLPTSTCFRHILQQTFRNWDGLTHILITKQACQDVFSGYLQPGCQSVSIFRIGNYHLQQKVISMSSSSVLNKLSFREELLREKLCNKHLAKRFRNWDGIGHKLITKYVCQDVFSGYLQLGCHISIHICWIGNYNLQQKVVSSISPSSVLNKLSFREELL